MSYHKPTGSRLRVVPSEEVLKAIDVISKTFRCSSSKVERFFEQALGEFSEVDAIDAVNFATIRELEVEVPADTAADTTTDSKTDTTAEDTETLMLMFLPLKPATAKLANMF